jgi:cytoskeletal protein RodZ
MEGMQEFYEEHPDVKALSNNKVRQLRHKLNVKAFGRLVMACHGLSWLVMLYSNFSWLVMYV